MMILVSVDAAGSVGGPAEQDILETLLIKNGCINMDLVYFVALSRRLMY